MNHIHWIARLTGGVLFLFFLVFLVAEGPSPLWGGRVREVISSYALLSLFTGLAVAWRWERVGGAMTIAGWLVLAGMARTTPGGPLLLAPVLVGAMHVVASFGPHPSRPRWVFYLLAGPLPLFLLLCANEVLGHPPLLARPSMPISDLAGVWENDKFTVTVRADGSATAVFDGQRVIEARVRANRTAFGRLLGWRTEYLLMGDGVNAPFNRLGDELRGSLGSGAIVLRARGGSRETAPSPHHAP